MWESILYHMPTTFLFYVIPSAPFLPSLSSNTIQEVFPILIKISSSFEFPEVGALAFTQPEIAVFTLFLFHFLLPFLPNTNSLKTKTVLLIFLLPKNQSIKFLLKNAHLSIFANEKVIIEIKLEGTGSFNYTLSTPKVS